MAMTGRICGTGYWSNAPSRASLPAYVHNTLYIYLHRSLHCTNNHRYAHTLTEVASHIWQCFALAFVYNLL